MGTAIIPGRDTPPVLELAECIFNKMSLLIQLFVERKYFSPAFPGWYADGHPFGFQRLPQPSRIIASVCQKRTVIGKEVLENGRPLVVTDLAFSQ